MADAGASQRRSQYTATTGTGQGSTLEPAGGKGESYFAGAQGTPENDRVSGTGKWKSGPFGIVDSGHDRPSYLADTPGEDFILPPPSGAVTHYLMRGVDSGTSNYTVWPAVSVPDPNGSQATVFNTTPVLVGSIVAGSGVIMVTWLV